MFYWLANFSDTISALNVFRYITFRAVSATVTALVFVFLFGPTIINIASVVGIIGIETSRGGKSQDVGSLGAPGGILRSHDRELPGCALPFDIIFQAFGGRR